MKVLLLSCKQFRSRITGLATRPAGVVAEPVTRTEYHLSKCIIALITVESSDDSQNSVQQLEREIRGFVNDTGIRNVVLFPFAHLSNRLCSSDQAVRFLNMLESRLTDLQVMRVHFGSHKSLLLDIHGHKGNVRFREF